MDAINPEAFAEDLTKCGICKETSNEPKALPCLHTFCLLCLKQWTESKATAKSIVCPTCKKTALLPVDGVDGLPGNFFVSSLIQRSRVLRPTDVACLCCEKLDSKLLARCLTCDAFLCNKGIDCHKTLGFLKGHHVINLDDLWSGKVNLSSVLTKQPTCDKHKGQPLWFFCETCCVLVCRDCTVVNHKSPEHKYVELDSAVKKQENVVKRLVEESIIVSLRVSDTLETVRSTRNRLEINATKTILDIDNAVQSTVEQIQKIGKSQKDKVSKWVADAHSKMNVTEEGLLSQRAQLKRAQVMANQVFKTGSNYDLASIYQQLTTSLQEMCALKPTSLESGLDCIVFSKDYTVSTNIKKLGSLSLGAKKVSSCEWVLKKEFGQRGPIKIKNPTQVAVTPTGDIAVASWDSSTPVHVFSENGQFQFSLDKMSSNARGIVVAPDDGRFFVTTDCKCVTVYNSKGQYMSKFPAVSPKGVKSSDMNASLVGLAIDFNNHLLVGEEKTKYISIHDLEGTHITSINVPLSPWYIAATRQNNIVISSRTICTGVHDATGKQLVAIDCPAGVTEWHPIGVYISLNDEICVSNYDEGANGIYCFSENGKYLRCVYKGFDSPEGIALTDNDQTLFVAEIDHHTIKVLASKNELKDNVR